MLPCHIWWFRKHPSCPLGHTQAATTPGPGLQPCAVCLQADVMLDDHTVFAQHCGSPVCASTPFLFSSWIHLGFFFFNAFSLARVFVVFFHYDPFPPPNKSSSISSPSHLFSPECAVLCTAPLSPPAVFSCCCSHLCPGSEGEGYVTLWQVSKGSCHTWAFG